MGLHQDSGSEIHTPFFLIQSRRNTFSAVYSLDKDAATLLGRPPRICRRFCSCRLPLDLDDEDILAVGGAVQLALAKLDQNGWNTTYNLCFSRAAWVRVRVLTSFVREDILELSLGISNNDVEKRVQWVTPDLRCFLG